MIRNLICFSAVIVVALGASCVPPQANFYWKSPCDSKIICTYFNFDEKFSQITSVSDQGFTNVLVPTDIQAYQNNKTLDSLGGIDITIDLVAVISLTNNYDKTVTKPLIDLAISDYTSTILGECKWGSLPTFGST